MGVVWDGAPARGRPPVDPARLRAVIARVDVPPLPHASRRLAEWVANYTLSPPGMVLRMMMSARRAFEPPAPRYGVRLAGPAPERLTPARARVLEVAASGMIWAKSALAEAAGVSGWRIIRRHIIPNLLGVVVVYVTLTIPQVILIESFLSFLGLGVQEPYTSWGALVNDGAVDMEYAPWSLAFPAAFLATTLFCFSFLGDGLRDALDPKDR